MPGVGKKHNKLRTFIKRLIALAEAAAMKSRNNSASYYSKSKKSYLSYFPSELNDQTSNSNLKNLKIKKDVGDIVLNHNDPIFSENYTGHIVEDTDDVEK